MAAGLSRSVWRRVGVTGPGIVTPLVTGVKLSWERLLRAHTTATPELKPFQAPANAADRASSTSRRKYIDRSRYGRTRANVAEIELGEDISAGRSRTYVREDDIESQTSTTLPEILRMDLHRRQNLPLLRSEVRVKRTGSGLAHTPEIADTWLTTDGEKPKSDKTEHQRQRDKHIVPQHRKYLTHGKVRTGGSSYKRQKLDDQRRVTVARQRIAGESRHCTQGRRLWPSILHATRRLTTLQTSVVPCRARASCSRN